MTRRRAVVVFAIAIALASWTISYSTQVGVIVGHGFGAWQAAGWPVCTEAAAIAVMLLLVMGEIRPGVWTVLSWGLVLACLAITTLINWLADPGDLIGAGLHSWTPVLSVAVFLLLVHGRPVESRASVTRRSARPAKGLPDRELTPARIEQVRAAIEATGRRATVPAMARRLRVSERTLARRLSEQRDLQVMAT